MSDHPRKPSAFPVEQPRAPLERPAFEPRQPRAIRDLSSIIQAETDIFDEPDVVTAPPGPAVPARKRSIITTIFMGALGVFVSLAIGLWMDQVIRDLFTRADWLGWLATGVAAIVVIGFFTLILREFLGLVRLKSVETIRTKGLAAYEADDSKAARHIVRELTEFLASKPGSASARARLQALENDIIDGADLIRIAEQELLVPLDQRAQIMILDAAKRVSMVTAVSPRALVDLAYVIFEVGRLIRRIADLYGGRPGTLGFFRLARNVLAHLAITGSMALGDGLVQQLVGQGLAARLSAKLGEGVVNGMMTARIGLAAMDTARPLPFIAAKRPGLSDFLSALTRFVKSSEKTE